MVHEIMAKRDGFEPEDDRKVAVPVEFRRPLGEVDRMRSMMAQLIVELRDNPHVESFEDSLDFDTGEEDDPISPSEMRFMKEEFLLTEAQEARKVALQRRAANEFKEKLYGKDRGRREGAERGGNRDAEKQRGDGSEKRGAGGEEGGRAAGGAGGEREGGEEVRRSV